MLKKYKHVIWDWNGTLFNDVELSLDIINSILENHSLNRLSLERYREIFTFPVKNYYREAGLDLDKYSFDVLGREWMDEYEKRKDEAQLYEGTLKVLNYINESAIEQSILSAYSQPALKEIVRLYNLELFFTNISGLDHIYASSKIALGKKLINDLEIPPEEVLLIGDTIHDFETSLEIGAECILIADGHQSKKRLEKCGVQVYNSIKEFTNFAEA